MKSRPTLLVISATIRRDLHRPLTRFRKFRVVHAYHDAAYGDLDAGDLGPDTVQYRSIRELRQLIDELKPDLIQGPEPVASRLMFQVAWVVWRYHRATGTPYFFPMFENLPLSHKFGPLVGWLMALVLARFARDAAWVFYLNEGAHRTLQAAGVPEAKLHRADWGNWGIDRQEFAPAVKPAAARATHPVILFIGRLSVAKGVDTLFDAFMTVRVEFPAAELWLVGPSTLDRGNETLLKKTVHLPGVQFLGPRRQRELPALIRQAWMTVLLSRTTKRWAEQVGMVNLQSLACGTPVVTTASGSIQEYLSDQNSGDRIQNSGLPRIPNSEFRILETNHGALLVPENDVDAAAAAILRVLQDPVQRESMGRAGVQWVKVTFDEAVNVPKLERETWQRYQATIDHSSLVIDGCATSRTHDQ